MWYWWKLDNCQLCLCAFTSASVLFIHLKHFCKWSRQKGREGKLSLFRATGDQNELKQRQEGAEHLGIGGCCHSWSVPLKNMTGIVQEFPASLAPKHLYSSACAHNKYFIVSALSLQMVKGGKRREKLRGGGEQRSLCLKRRKGASNLYIYAPAPHSENRKCTWGCLCWSWYQHNWGQMVTRHSCLPFQAELNPKVKLLEFKSSHPLVVWIGFHIAQGSGIVFSSCCWELSWCIAIAGRCCMKGGELTSVCKAWCCKGFLPL